jgi:hypothetical protein
MALMLATVSLLETSREMVLGLIQVAARPREHDEDLHRFLVGVVGTGDEFGRHGWLIVTSDRGGFAWIGLAFKMDWTRTTPGLVGTGLSGVMCSYSLPCFLGW